MVTKVNAQAPFRPPEQPKRGPKREGPRRVIDLLPELHTQQMGPKPIDGEGAPIDCQYRTGQRLDSPGIGRGIVHLSSHQTNIDHAGAASVPTCPTERATTAQACYLLVTPKLPLHHSCHPKCVAICYTTVAFRYICGASADISALKEGRLDETLSLSLYGALECSRYERSKQDDGE